VPLPLFDTNDGERARARAVRARLAAERGGQRLAIAAEVREALVAFEQARAALALYDDAVLGAQDEASALLRRAVEAGEVGVADVIVVQREVLEGRAGYLDARLSLALARVRLLAAADLPQTGPLETGPVRGDAR
jgi:cobalt-zinc-cadmium efflux system outer membrane protein